MLSQFNKNDFGLFFTSDFGSKCLPFLDLSLAVTSQGLISTTIYRKPTSTNSLLHFSSFHPIPLKRGIPVGQYLRLRRNCSDLDDFKIKAIDLRNRFIQRGYPKRCLKRAYKRAYKRALESDHQTLIFANKAPNMETKQSDIRCVGTYNNQWQSIKSIMQRHWSVLKGDRDLGPILPHLPSLVARRSTSLGDILVHSHYSERRESPSHFLTSTVGSYKYHRCEACQYMVSMKYFQRPGSQIKFEIRQFINCRTAGVIYVGMCSCPMLYVGKTFRELRKRVLEHIGTINNKKETPLARHIRDFHHSDVTAISFFGIEKVKLGPRKGDINNLLLKKECEWIHRLKSRAPLGLNEGFTFTPFIRKR
uniref:Helix-turn-helix domain-containing protein n=1 Tax=Xenopus tropicalis TaxID=8364 RepID=A0A1B8XZB9_XENTR